MAEEQDVRKQFLEQNDDGDEINVPSEVISDSYLMGFVKANIVGLRYSRGINIGIIDGRELVGLVREPLNPDDPNAIKVLNTRTVLVGHIERSVSAVLAPLIDSQIISAGEALVPKHKRESREPYCLPCQIHIFAVPDAIPTVKRAIEDGGLHLFTPHDHEFAISDSAIVKESTSYKASQQLRRIDEIFELVGKEGKEIVPLEPPKDIILTELFDHQKEGLGWLMQRENSKDLPLFWKERNGGFLNVLTNHLTFERPEPLRGGIFADDMGLGKTLTLLSLIASTKASCVTRKRKRRSGSRTAVGSRKKSKVDVAELLSPRTTLVVCPSSALSTWITQLEEHTRPGSLQVYLYHGERTKEVEFLLKHDIVLTTYNTLALEFSSPQSPLKEIEWLRVILDEAHVINNFESQQTKAVVELKAERRWVVTGTPIQNGSFDLFSLMAFLRFQPFSIQSYWLSLINRPLYKGYHSGISRLQALLVGISLRRIKGTDNESGSLVLLPPKTVETYFVELTSEERRLYENMESEARYTMKECIINDQAVLRHYSTAQHVIQRLRQICNNVALCPSDLKSLLSSNILEDVSKNPELLKKLTSLLADEDDFDCPVCFSPPEKTIITCCAHIFCQSCILKTLKTLNPCCPLCRKPLSKSDLFLAPPPEPSDENPTTNLSTSPVSSKVSALLHLLLETKKQNESTKSVVFSQFRKMLVLLEEPLRHAGFNLLRLDGLMSTKKRAAVIKEFSLDQPNGPTVLLASLKAAGAGLNLTAASRVYFVEPWWNPAAEEQAMDRVHRIGQKEEVKVVRLIVKDSIEESIMLIQEDKRRFAGDLFGKQFTKLQREMRVDDIRDMLRM